MSSISKETVRMWLVNYSSLAAREMVISENAMPVNSGPKNVDGISGALLNKVMLDQALSNLRKHEKDVWACVMLRWVRRLSKRKATELLDIPSSTYYERCEEGVVYIWRSLNGGGHALLIEKINEGLKTEA